MLRRSHPLARRQNFGDGGGEIVDAGARDDDGVAAAVRFFGDAEKFSAIVFAQLDVEMLPLDLQLLGLDNVVHGGSRGV